MTNQAILTKAIAKAIENGWDAELRDTGLYIGGNGNYQDAIMSYHGDNYLVDYNVIFNHQFAQALWGDGELEIKEFVPHVRRFAGDIPPLIEPQQPLWAVHLQQMVIAEDPIKYLGDNL